MGNTNKYNIGDLVFVKWRMVSIAVIMRIVGIRNSKLDLKTYTYKVIYNLGELDHPLDNVDYEFCETSFTYEDGIVINNKDIEWLELLYAE